MAGRAVLLRRFPREGDEGSNPLPSAPCPDGETEDHTSVLTRSFGFESWSGHWDIRAVSSAGQSASMTRWRPQVRSLHRPLGRAEQRSAKESPTTWTRKGHPIGDGTRLESGRAMSLAGSTPAPSAPARAGGFDGSSTLRWCPWCNGSTRARGARGDGFNPRRTPSPQPRRRR